MRKMRLWLVLIFIFPIIARCFKGFNSISVDQFYKKLKQNADLFILDVRSPVEHKTFHIKGSSHLPIQLLKELIPKLESKKKEEIYVISHDKQQSAYASKLLSLSGFKKVYQIKEGMSGWASKGYPVSHALGKSFKNMTVSKLYEKLKENPKLFILDVRTVEEYQKFGHIKGSTLIPVQELMKRVGEIDDRHSEEVYIICHTGYRSTFATDILLSAGFKKLINVLGGMKAWKENQFPIRVIK